MQEGQKQYSNVYQTSEQKNLGGMPAPPPPKPPQTRSMPAPPPPLPHSFQPKVDGKTEVHTDSSASEKLKQASEQVKKKKEQMKQKFETFQQDEKMGDLKGHTKTVLDFFQKFIYLISYEDCLRKVTLVPFFF